MRKTPMQPPGGSMEAMPVGYPYQMCGIDVFDPLPLSSRRNQHILVRSDYMTKYVETKAVPAQSAVALADFLVQ